mmetsp:Transcript_30240/g.46312  ORF Transcript_30240/g.46312 Transcript_30240/m.46312 type:complete len:235 (+) Transcript_30240:319-1023(+)
MDLVFWQDGSVQALEVNLCFLVQSNVSVGFHKKVKFVVSLGRSQKLNVVFHNAFGVGNLFDADDLAFLGSQCHPPSFLLGEWKARSVHEAGFFALLQIVSRYFNLDGDQVSFVYLVVFVVVNKNLAVNRNIGDKLQSFEYIFFLGFRKGCHSSFFRVGDSLVGLNILCSCSCFALIAMLDFFIREMRKLQQRTVSDPACLGDVLTKLDAVHGCLEPILVFAYGDHGINEGIGIT